MTKTDEEIRGNVFYDVRFRDQTKVISISYENIEDYLQIILFKLKNGQLPDYDDKTSTLHLNALNKLSFPKASKADIELNNSFFSNLNGEDELTRKLLKSAKDLRLSLRLIGNL